MIYRLLIFALAACGANKNTPDDATHSSSSTTSVVSVTTTGIATTGSATTGPPDDACSDQIAVDDCCCFGHLDQEPYVDVLCPTESLCGTVVGECALGFSDCTSDNVAEIDCTLAALQGSKPGSVEWELRWIGADQPELYVTVYISGKGDAFWLGVENTGDPINLHGVQRYLVDDLGLSACDEEPDAGVRFECIRAAFTNSSEICLEPHQGG